jgi:hypothetical protein
MMEFSHYQQFYVPKDFTTSEAPKTSNGKCYVFLTYHCARNGLPLGPSSLLRHPLPSRTDYDSYTSC